MYAPGDVVTIRGQLVDFPVVVVSVSDTVVQIKVQGSDVVLDVPVQDFENALVRD